MEDTCNLLSVFWYNILVCCHVSKVTYEPEAYICIFVYNHFPLWDLGVQIMYYKELLCYFRIGGTL